MKWKRTNSDSGPVHESDGGNFVYKITRAKRGLYEVHQKCTEGAVGVSGRPFPAHFEWYYLTNFNNVKEARSFIEKYDVGEMGLTEWDREPFIREQT